MKRFASISILVLTLGLAATAFAAGPDAQGKALFEAKCQSCHGVDGRKTTLSKSINGLKEDAALKAMNGYKAKTYGSTKKATMENLCSKLSDADIKALAAYISKLQ
ncbi:MAG: c-type cytochrome [Humidesulfovibrio sp.]|nr:c-type cytochrome [Humidesulfovibrio sp.]